MSYDQQERLIDAIKLISANLENINENLEIIMEHSKGRKYHCPNDCPNCL